MIDVATETLLSLDSVAEKLQVSKATVKRWIRSGTNGVKLEAIKFGAHWRTSEEAVQRFGESQTPSYEPQIRLTVTKTRSAAQRQRAIEKAEEELDEGFGIRKCESCRKVIDPGYLQLPKKRKIWCPKCLIQRESATMGQRIFTFRWDAKLSIAEFYKRTKINAHKLSDYENDKAFPTKEHLEKLIQLFGNDLVHGLDVVESEEKQDAITKV